MTIKELIDILETIDNKDMQVAVFNSEEYTVVDEVNTINLRINGVKQKTCILTSL